MVGSGNDSKTTCEGRNDEALLLGAERLSEILGVSKRTLWRLRSAGRLPRPVSLGGSIRWRADEIRRWIGHGCPPLKDWEASHTRQSRA